MTMKRKLVYTKQHGWHAATRTCPNCNEELDASGHYVPPSLGEEGFFICTHPTTYFTTTNIDISSG
jgi:hypothetical protein